MIKAKFYKKPIYYNYIDNTIIGRNFIFDFFATIMIYIHLFLSFFIPGYPLEFPIKIEET